MLPIIVPARMNSRRLPGKPLRDIAGKPLLQWVIESLEHVEGGAGVVVATSTDSRDDALAAWCAARGCACYRGSLDDVAGRVLGAARARGAEAFVRVSGDSPLLDPALVDRAVELYQGGGVDLVTNVFPRSFPVGQSVEVLSRAALERVLAETAHTEDREHVTRWVYANQDRYRILNFAHERDESGVRLAVDSPEDLRRIERIVAAMTGPHTEYGLPELLRLAREGAAGAR